MEDSDEENPPGFARDGLSSSDSYGKLIWPRFYGLGVYNAKHRKYDKIGFFAYLIILIIWPIVFGRYLYLRDPTMFTLISVILCILLAVCIIIYSIYRRRKSEKNAIHIMHKNGVFDWDMYETGMLVKYYSENLPGKIERKFIRFKDLSKVYINIDAKNAHRVMDAMKKTDQKKIDYIPDDYIATKDRIEYYKNEIHFVDRNGCLLDDEIDKENLDNITRFESIIRQNVNDVE